MRELDWIILDTVGWDLRSRGEREIVWQGDQHDSMALLAFTDGLEFDVESDDLDAIRRVAREQLRDVDGCVLEIDRVEFQQVPALRQLLKFRVGRSLVYRGSYSLPFGDLGYVIQIDCPMVGTVGLREMIVAERLANDGAPGKWWADPYDPDFEAPLLRAISDDEEFDALVPDHPLSRLRAALARLPQTTAIDLRLYAPRAARQAAAPTGGRGGVPAAGDRSAAGEGQTVGRGQR